ncbi:MAG: efflux RND transporter periplasmic adaptor subunit [Candidatus Moranbacteria bacterium]|nr:efflux RND transporter periplasmic adaptor subunit [Candidatus Moranbacteria bacterium]
MQEQSKKQRYIILVIIISIAATTGTIFLRKTKAQNPTPAPIVKTIIAKEADKNSFLEISGFVRGENRADISPQASGRILRIFKHEGDLVKKGDVLATIDSSQADAQVAAAEASTQALQATLNDSKKYYDQLVSQSKEAPSSDATDEAIKSAKRGRDLQIQAAKNQLIAAQGALSIAQAGRKNSTVLAPFAGTITAVNGREGGFANFSMPIVSISTKNSFEIETYVSATDGRNIAVGNIATLQATDNAPISGIVTTVSTGADSQSLKTLIRIHLNDAPRNVYLGDFLHGKIMFPREQSAISIPRSAIISRGGDTTVFIIDENNVAKEQAIRTIGEHDGFADVISGITANQKIVTEGQQYLINGITTTPYATN